jgi:hypothetical protein
LASGLRVEKKRERPFSSFVLAGGRKKKTIKKTKEKKNKSSSPTALFWNHRRGKKTPTAITCIPARV